MRKAVILVGSVLFGLIASLVHGQITESPETVAPGRFLLEMDALSLTIDRNAGAKYTGVGAATTFLTTGLTANWDIQLGAELFLSQKYEQGSFTERHSGIGDVYVRTKWRMFSDTETGTALAVMPYIKIPTNSGGVGNHSMEGGLIVPWAVILPVEFSFAAMVQLDFLRNDKDDGYDTALYGSMALSRQVTKTIGLYAELTAGKSSGGAAWAGGLGGGVTFAVSDKISWDFAVYRGISRGAADWNPVLRLNWGF